MSNIVEDTAVNQENALAMRLSDMDPGTSISFLIENAFHSVASDLYFVAYEHTVEVSTRRLGIVHPVVTLPLQVGTRLMAFIRAEANMDSTEGRHPAEGRWQYTRSGGSHIDLRLNAMPTLYGESIAMRLLVRESKLYQLDQLGFERSQHDAMLEMLHRPGGLIIVTGPTGCGKTTSVYAFLHYLNDGRRSHSDDRKSN